MPQSVGVDRRRLAARTIGRWNASLTYGVRLVLPGRTTRSPLVSLSVNSDRAAGWSVQVARAEPVVSWHVGIGGRTAVVG